MERFDPRRPDAIPHAGTFNNNVLTMAAGNAGLSKIFTADAADALFARGETFRARLNAVSRAPMQWIGLGSLLCVHFRTGPIDRPMPADEREADLRELFFFDMLSRGFYLARRGMIAMSLEIGEAEMNAFVAAVAEFVQTNAGLLDAA
jgi:glutamate-1-semialdehyde 2,1-aminomutase